MSVKVDKTLQNDLETTRFYQDINDDADDADDDDADETHETIDEETIRRLYQKQYEHTVKQMNNNSNTIPEVAPDPPSNDRKKRRRTARSIRNFFSYEWLRDDRSIIMLKSDENQAINLNGFTLFPNGTLKFQASNLTGEYRCKAKYVTTRFAIGPILSTATIVEVPSKL